MAHLIDYVRGYEYDLHDLSVAFYRVACRRYGEDAIRGVVTGRVFRHRSPVSFFSIKTGVNEETKGIQGLVMVDDLARAFGVGGEGGVPIISVFQIKTEHRKEVEVFLAEIEEQLKTASIYKGKALDINRDFLDLSAVRSEKIIYPVEVERDLEAHVWSFMRKRDLCVAADIPPQRKVLLAGPYGSGKTITAFRTAQIAVECGRTFIYLPPTAEGSSRAIDMVYQFARRYQPAAVFIEDIDREQRHEDSFTFGRILAAIDGLHSKGTQILTVMTANRWEKLAGGMQRPGRTDKIIDFSKFGPVDAIRLLQETIPVPMRSATINWDAVGEACEDFTAAFVREVGTSAKLLAISDAKNSQPSVTEQMLVLAAKGLRAQHDRCSEDLGFGSNR